jgi:hypothetical protein
VMRWSPWEDGTWVGVVDGGAFWVHRLFTAYACWHGRYGGAGATFLGFSETVEDAKLRCEKYFFERSADDSAI